MCNRFEIEVSLFSYSEQSLAFAIIFLPAILLAFVHAACKRKRAPSNLPRRPADGEDKETKDSESEKDNPEGPFNVHSGSSPREGSPQPDVISPSSDTHSDDEEITSQSPEKTSQSPVPAAQVPVAPAAQVPIAPADQKEKNC